MHPSFVPPRQVRIGDAATFVGSTPRAIRHYHEIGLLPEPDRGADDRRRYGYEDMIRLLWIRRMADAGIALDDIRDAFPTDGAAGATDGDEQIAQTLERLEQSLADQEAELRRKRAAVQRMRTEGSRMGLLSDAVTTRLATAPEGSVRQTDLDTLLVTERSLGPLAAAIQATRFVTLAQHPELREESDRVDAAEEALDDTVAVDDPRVAEVARERHAFETALHAAIDASGWNEADDVLIDTWDDTQPAGDDGGAALGVAEAIGMMPYDFSPARLRCMDLALELSVGDAPAP